MRDASQMPSWQQPALVVGPVSAFGLLKNIQTDAAKAKDKLDELSEKAAAVEKDLAAAAAKHQQMAEDLAALEAAKKLGFDQPVLKSLAGLAAGYGSAKPVIAAVGKHSDFAELLGKIAEAKKELAKWQAKASQAEVKHGHLLTAIRMCESLISDHELGLDAVATIKSLAGKFGRTFMAGEDYHDAGYGIHHLC